MNTSHMHDKDILARQYRDSSNLEIRKNFHQKYGSNPVAFTDWILSKIRFFEGCRVLEVGCGTGGLWANTPQLVESFSELALTDASEGMIERARQSYAGRVNVRLQVMDVLEMPFEAHSFDIIVANSMLYHVREIDAALADIRRVLRPAGAFYATTFGKEAVIHYIDRALIEMGLADATAIGAISFTLENGGQALRRHFSAVRVETYENPLDVSDPVDLVEYIYSMASMSRLDRSHRERMLAYFESQKDRNGILTIPQASGMFIASGRAA